MIPGGRPKRETAVSSKTTNLERGRVLLLWLRMLPFTYVNGVTHLCLQRGTHAEELPIAIETIFAVLVHRARTGNLSALIRMHARGEVVLVLAAPGQRRPSSNTLARTMIRPTRIFSN
jgi:hypothetical protein